MLILAALTDLRERRIPNWLTGGAAALYPVYLMLSPVPVAWLERARPRAARRRWSALVLFARELIGGGDVKLIAAVTLWAGLDHFAPFALVTSLTGGMLGLASLWFQRWSPSDPGPPRRVRPGRRRRRAGARRPPGGPAATRRRAERPAPLTLPYGIAIAAGGVAVVVELMKL